MKKSKSSSTSKVVHIYKSGVSTLIASAALLAVTAGAADIQWQGSTASYTNGADWVGGVVPGAIDNAINDHGTNNVVQINVGDPDWMLNGIWAGNGTGDGAFEQNGQTVTLTGTNYNGSVQTVYSTPLRLGIASGDTGVYTLNGGTNNYGTGGLNVGELGTGILNISGGAITGSGSFADNLGTLATPTAVTATVGGGLTYGDFTWFQQGFYTPNTSLGLPAPGSTITSVMQSNHSYTLAPSYTANDAVMISSNVTSATITPAAPLSGCSGLSLLGSAGNGPVVVNYTVHHADNTTETGSITVPDWFGPVSNTNMEVMAVGARVNALGVNFQLPGPANGLTGNAPYLFSFDFAVTNTASAVTSVDLSLASATHNGAACLLALSSSTGSGYTPVSITGYNEDMIVESGAQVYVSSSVTDVVNQTGGAVNVTGGGQWFVGNVGNGVYNLSGGSIDVHNYIAFGRSSGSGTVNMTGGTLNQDGGGNLLVGTGYNNNGNSATGVLNQSGGAINCQGQFLVPESSPSTGTYNLSGTGTLVVNNWIAIGRNAGNGVVNMDGGSITKGGGSGSHLDIGASAVGTLNQTNGVITNVVSDTWLGENGTATWNLEGGSAILGKLIMCINGSATATLNLDGGLLQATGINSSSIGFSTINFNGGTLQAAANNANFMSGISMALLGPGGLTIDSQSYNITIPQELDDNGGGALTKLGSGTLILSGPNTYTGPTVVSGGTLDVQTVSAASGGYSVADGAALGVTVTSANAQLNMASLNAGSSTGATLDFDLGNFGNPSSAPMNVSGTVAINGTTALNIADAQPQIGEFPLLHYGTLAGSGNLVLGSLPAGMTAAIVTNVANSTIDLSITSVNQPRWDGQAGGTWDLGSDTNWVNMGTGLPTTFTDGNPVLFNDSALGTTNVNITTTVQPSSVTVNNSILNYTFTGAGSISGATGLSKSGSGTLSIATANSYTGPTVISGGTLSVASLANSGSPSAIGAASASPTNLVINNATFQYTGAPVTANRGFEIANTNSVIDAEGNLTLGGPVAASSGQSAFIKTGPAQLGITSVGDNEFASGYNPGLQVVAGTLLLDGSAGGQTNHTVNDMYVGDTPNSGAALALSNTTLNVDGWFAVGRINGGINNLSSVSLYNSALTVGNLSFGWDGGQAGNLSSQSCTLNGTSTLTDHGAVNLCEGNGSTLTMNINGSSVFQMQNPAYIALANNSTSTVVVANSGQLIQTSGWFDIAQGNNSVGTFIVKDNANVSLDSDFNVTDTGTGAFATAIIAGNASLTANNLWVGKQNGVTAVLTITNNATVNSHNGLTMATYYDGSPRIPAAAILNLDGGSLAVNLVQGSTTSGTNYGTFNFNGGTLIAQNPFAANFMFNLGAINVLAGGANIDSASNTISIAQSLLNGGGGGGLTKLGAGTLRLNGTNTYDGATLVSAGKLDGIGSIAGPVTVASGATLGAGAGSIGTLTINSNLTFQAGSTNYMKIGAGTNDLITGLTAVSYSGTLVVTNTSGTPLSVGSTFQLFSSATAGSGNFASIKILPSGSGTFDPSTGVLTISGGTAVTFNPPVVSNGNLILTGNGGAAPGSSYTLLTTTNVALPLANWSTNTTGTLDSSGMFSNSIPINATEASRFFDVRVP